MASIIPIRGATMAPAAERSKMETLLLTPELVKEWEVPPFQRPLRVNDKVRAIAEALQGKDGGVINGILTLGMLPNDRTLYILDGQHRREAVLLSGLKEFIADVRIMRFDDMAEMALEFVKLNSAIVKMQPDDVLRGLEGSLKPLQFIRKQCDYVGYGWIRSNNPNAPIIGMSTLLRCWRGSDYETPGVTGGKSGPNLAKELTMEEAEGLVDFLRIAIAAWGKDLENARLWSQLNLTMTMWMWRNLVIDRDRSGQRRYIVLAADQFKRCLMSVSADKDYLAWLVGRSMCERDRSPAYRRLKQAFLARLKDEEGLPNHRFPQPGWSTAK